MRRQILKKELIDPISQIAMTLHQHYQKTNKILDSFSDKPLILFSRQGWIKKLPVKKVIAGYQIFNM